MMKIYLDYNASMPIAPEVAAVIAMHAVIRDLKVFILSLGYMR
jgi:cysteine sulfinate desulfinase/cysteine desulfurase-like protein